MKLSVKTAIILIIGFVFTTSISGQFIHQLAGDKYPWTRIPVITNNNFRFVIISDLTGGEKEGVFESVITKINQLAPDFVMCVGDLIDGYTVDSTVMKGQWKSFHDRIAKLNAPFIYLPGNHDIANNMLFNYWIQQYGYDYYSFKVGNSLFLMLNAYESEQGELSDKQVQYLINVLQAHDIKYPVYVFSHPPLWDLYNQKGLSELEPLLSKYKTTFFCGDDHHYIRKEVNRHIHYMLSNTGGGFDTENINLGVFNHILWVTANDEGLTVANILTDGIIPPDIVDNITEKQVYTLLENDWFKIQPTYIYERSAGQFKSNLVLKNHGDLPLQVTGGFIREDNIAFTPDPISYTVASGTEVSIPVTISNDGNYDVDDFPEIKLELTGTYLQNGKILRNSEKKIWIIDNLKSCYSKTRKIENIFCRRPGAAEESWSWNGPGDGSFQFSTTYDSDNIYLKITTTDDIIVVDSLLSQNPQDKIFIHFSADTSFTSKEYLSFQLSGGEKILTDGIKKRPGENITGSCSVINNMLSANLTIPRKNLKSDFFRLNIGFRDQDDTTSSDQSIIWWKPRWGSVNNYPGSGMFQLKQ